MTIISSNITLLSKKYEITTIIETTDELRNVRDVCDVTEVG